MKAYLKAYLISLGIIFFFLILVVICHWGVYMIAKEDFESFFSVEIKPFNLISYLHIWFLSSAVLALFIKSDFEVGE